MLAGDSRSALVDLVNDGTTPLSAVTLTSTATSSSVLDQDTVNGLQLTVESCSVAWTTGAAAPTCSGTVRSYFTQPILVTNVVAGLQRGAGRGRDRPPEAHRRAAQQRVRGRLRGCDERPELQFTGVQQQRRAALTPAADRTRRPLRLIGGAAVVLPAYAGADRQAGSERLTHGPSTLQVTPGTSAATAHRRAVGGSGAGDAVRPGFRSSGHVLRASSRAPTL